MNYITGAIFWFIAWAAASPEKTIGQILVSALFSFAGLIMWELAMQDYRGSK